MADGPGIIPLQNYAVERPPPRREFQAWHRPRKQHVREQQWATEALELLGERQGLEQSRALRYLTLPGSDLLDVRYLHEQVCRPNETPLRFLGFDHAAAPLSSEQAAHNVSMMEVRALPLVDDFSEVLGHDLRSLAAPSHIASQRASAHGPFDLINIDLCGNVTLEEAGLDNTLYEAVRRLFVLQDRWRDPWVLFLTTRLSRDAVSPVTLDRLDKLVAENVLSCAPFQQALERLLELRAVDPYAAGTWTAQQQYHLLTVQIGKWLLGLARGIKCAVTLKSCVTYQVAGGSQANDMASLAFRFTPKPRDLHDAAGLAANPRVVSDNECGQAARLTTQVAHGLDIDALLSTDSAYRGTLIEDTIRLLGPKYDAPAYREWAEGHTL